MGCEWTLKAIDRQVVIKVLARCTVRVGFENVIDRVFNNADAQTERRRLGVKKPCTCSRRTEKKVLRSKLTSMSMCDTLCDSGLA